MPSEDRPDPFHDVSGGSNGELLAGDLKEESAVQVHRRKIIEPCMGVEVGAAFDETSDDRVHLTKVLLGVRSCAVLPPVSGRRDLASVIWVNRLHAHLLPHDASMGGLAGLTIRHTAALLTWRIVTA